MRTDLVVIEDIQELPPIPVESNTPEMQQRYASFLNSIAGIFEAWIERQENAHTKRNYRQSVLQFIRFKGIRWPEEDWRLIRDVSVDDAQRWRDALIIAGTSANTRNSYISACSRFYDYLQKQTARMRLPILIANPFDREFIQRKTPEPRHQAEAIPLEYLQRLLSFPEGDAVIAWRDRALLYFLYGLGVREDTACRALVSDIQCRSQEEGPTAVIRVKGGKTLRMGLHQKAYDQITAYMKVAQRTRGALFPKQVHARVPELSIKPMTTRAMTYLLRQYFAKLPEAFVEVKLDNGETKWVQRYSAHSFRRTAATLLLKQHVDIRKVQDFLGHRQVATTQIYDGREFTFREGVSHDLPM